MNLFAALASLLTLAALAFVLWPLWRRARGATIAAIVMLSIATFALYWLVGTPAALAPQTASADGVPATLEEAITQLEAELQRNPNEPEGWRLLGRSYAAQQRHADAQAAFDKAVRLLPDDPNLLTEAAQARLFASADKQLDAQGLEMLQKALQLDPANQRARWFLGVAQRQNGQPADAAATWEPLLAQVDAATAARLRPQIDEARTEAGLPPLPAAVTAPAADAAGAHAVTINVSLDPDFASRVRLRGDASVFVIARQPGGPPMPVAVEKRSLQELPLTVTLDDADSPMPTQKLSALAEVEVFARLSASGNATRQEGDLDSAPVRVRLPADAPVELVIGRSD